VVENESKDLLWKNWAAVCCPVRHGGRRAEASKKIQVPRLELSIESLEGRGGCVEWR
jgi:hypothetical protein